LVIAGSITTGELLLAGLVLGAALLVLGTTGSLARLAQYLGDPVVRGVQFGVALVLLETGLRLGAANLPLAGLAAVVAIGSIAVGYWNLSAFVVLCLGGIITALQTGVPAFGLPSLQSEIVQLSSLSFTADTAEAVLGQFAMTVGNAALAASVLLDDYFDRPTSPDELSVSMGLMNLAAVPLGGFPMCHGSGGIAGKYAFGARTAGANVVLGVGYITAAVLAVGMVAAYPTAVLGVILALVAAQLGWTSLRENNSLLFVVGIGVLGVVVNLAVAFLAGVVASLAIRRFSDSSP
jgi:MFS superfamily sulfate permease-like transporter